MIWGFKQRAVESIEIHGEVKPIATYFIYIPHHLFYAIYQRIIRLEWRYRFIRRIQMELLQQIMTDMLRPTKNNRLVGTVVKPKGPFGYKA